MVPPDTVAAVCASCFTRLDAAVLSSAGAVTAVSVGWQRLADARRGTSRAARRRARYDETAAFLRSLGHDPEAVLGPTPALKAEVAARG